MRSELRGGQGSIQYANPLVLKAPSYYLQALHQNHTISRDLEHSDYKRLRKSGICRPACKEPILAFSTYGKASADRKRLSVFHESDSAGKLFEFERAQERKVAHFQHGSRKGSLLQHARNQHAPCSLRVLGRIK